jgi:hypothetical protein
MGVVSELISVLGPGGAGAALAGSLMAWLKTRRPGLTMVVQRADGARYELSASSTDQTDKAVARFLDAALATDPGDSDAQDASQPAPRSDRTGSAE